MQFLVRIPFAETLGFELLRFERDEAEIAVELRDELTNSWGVAHGGVTMTLLDVAMAHAARSPGPSGEVETMGAATIEMKTTFMRPGAAAGCVARAGDCTAPPSMAFCEGSVFDADEQLVAHATGTFKFLKGLPVGGKRIQRPDASD